MERTSTHRKERKEPIEAAGFRIEQLELIEREQSHPGLFASVTNTSEFPAALGVVLEARPGMWFQLHVWKASYQYRILPGGPHEIDIPVQFPKRTPDSQLRLRFGSCSSKDDGQFEVVPFAERSIAVGASDTEDGNAVSRFDHHRTDRFDVYAWKGSHAARDAEEIAVQREAALSQISEMLRVDVDDRIVLAFYPDEATKLEDTLHRGAGWAIGNTLVEVYNDEIRLDPYHELAHIVTESLGEPPTMFNEGFAVHVAEQLGGDALCYLGAPGKTVHDVVHSLHQKDALLPLTLLVTFTEIGSEETQAEIAYPQSASIVKHLIDAHGLEPLRRAYAALQCPNTPEAIAENGKLWAAVFGESIEETEQSWRASL